jgi:hypothetical protein
MHLILANVEISSNNALFLNKKKLSLIESLFNLVKACKLCLFWMILHEKKSCFFVCVLCTYFKFKFLKQKIMFN